MLRPRLLLSVSTVRWPPGACRWCSGALRRPGRPDSRGRGGVLYVVATHLGNIDDISVRAAEVLTTVPVIAAESIHTAEAMVAGLRSSLVSRGVEEVAENWSTQLDGFIAANRFDDRAVLALRELSPQVQSAIMKKGGFDSCRNPSSELMSRIRKARKVAAGAEGRSIVSYHSHNECERAPELIELLKSGTDVALVSRAGTPGWRSPGQVLVDAAHRQGIIVKPLPGPSSVAAALAASGLSGDRVLFEGYLPALRALRFERLRQLRTLGATDCASTTTTAAIFCDAETLDDLLADVVEVLGSDVSACIAKALTTQNEQVVTGSLGVLRDRWARGPSERRRGAVVLLLELPSVLSDGAELPGAEYASDTTAEEREMNRVVQALARSGIPQHKVALLAMQLCGTSMSLALRASQQHLLGDAPSAPDASSAASDGSGAGTVRTLHLRNLGASATSEAVSVALEQAGIRRFFVQIFENNMGEKVAFARFASSEHAAAARVSINLAAIDLGAGQRVAASWAHRERWIA